MSMYRCNRCERFCDDDYNVCTADPKDPRELMCENCTADEEDDEPSGAFASGMPL
jgi:hypothetical protein